jgi:hypothetical protein
MRLYKYIQLSSKDRDILKFRAINIGLTNEKTNYDDVVLRIQKQFVLKADATALLNKINEELVRFYSGKYRFDFIIDEGVDVDSIKIRDKKRIDLLKQKVFEFNEELNSIKEEFESKIQ